MAASYEQIKQDATWVQPNPATDLHLNTRNHGHIYINQYAPNYDERMEMTFRSIGRQHDWDLEKFRVGPKPSDKGNRRRMIRNAVRFLKNPYSVAFWRFKAFNITSRISKFVFYLVFPLAFLNAYKETVNDSRVPHFYKAMGDSINGYGFDHLVDKPDKTLVKHGFFSTFGSGFIQARHIGVNPSYEFNYLKQRETIERNRQTLAEYTGQRSINDMHAAMFGKK